MCELFNYQRSSLTSGPCTVNVDTFGTETGKAFEKALGEKCVPFHKCLAPKELPSKVFTGRRLSEI